MTTRAATTGAMLSVRPGPAPAATTGTVALVVVASAAMRPMRAGADAVSRSAGPGQPLGMTTRAVPSLRASPRPP
ncbi:hypothetical protein [Microbispora hainanensis]|uniref:Uncharacterized protein n=1 Tax=Microbispora hainanensis TaxID=568844 RepID=A0ABZ1SHT3_9ACTN|nr:hypothetical protein [Microbispora hainanensis]